LHYQSEGAGILSADKTGHTILFVDCERRRWNLIQTSFDQSAIPAMLEFVPSIEDAHEKIRRWIVDVLFLVRSDCGRDGIDFFRNIKASTRNIGSIMVIPRLDHQLVIQALKAGIDECVPDGDAAIAGFPAAVERVLARRLAAHRASQRADAIIESQKQWMSILDAITDYIFVVDEDRRLLKVNSAFATVFGLQPRDVVGKHCRDLFGSDIVSECASDDGSDGKSRTYEKTIREETYQISIFPLYEGDRTLSVHVMKNITELRRLKDQLYHADKLASIGLLVSGVAHELNNPLTGTIAYTELLSLKVADEAVKKDLTKILDSAERCKKIIDNLLTFSRQRSPAKSLESINDIVDRAIDLRGYWLRSNNIEIIRDFTAATTVFVDTQQMQQVVLNILLNAEQAIAGSGRTPGRIIFTTRLKAEERTVIVRIADNGPGIPEAVISKIFDPFFTTKPVGIGTGLGLSIAHGIVTEHGGSIRVENVEGGSAFVIELPTGAGSFPVKASV
jgi:PAS domain S-box-containing protein